MIHPESDRILKLLDKALEETGAIAARAHEIQAAAKETARRLPKPLPAEWDAILELVWDLDFVDFFGSGKPSLGLASEAEARNGLSRQFPRCAT